MTPSIDEIVLAFSARVRRALESGGTIEFQVEAYPSEIMWTSSRPTPIPQITTITITDWTKPETPYDELIESLITRNQERFDAKSDSCGYFDAAEYWPYQDDESDLYGRSDHDAEYCRRPKDELDAFTAGVDEGGIG